MYKETKVQVRWKESEGERFFYVDLGSEIHDRPSARLWISSKLVEPAENGFQVELTGKRALVQTVKGNWVLKPSPDLFVFLVGWECGYRGHSSFLIKDRVKRILQFKEYKSPRGSLGISEYALVCHTEPELKVNLYRSGRLYGAPSKQTVIYRALDSGQEVIPLEEIAEDPELKSELTD